MGFAHTLGPPGGNCLDWILPKWIPRGTPTILYLPFPLGYHCPHQESRTTGLLESVGKGPVNWARKGILFRLGKCRELCMQIMAEKAPLLSLLPPRDPESSCTYPDLPSCSEPMRLTLLGKPKCYLMSSTIPCAPGTALLCPVLPHLTLLHLLPLLVQP